MSEAQLVRYETRGDVAMITVDNPPVNALSPGVDDGILDGLAKANADAAVKAVVLIGAGRSFIAGADIRQFGKRPPRPPALERAHVIIEQPRFYAQHPELILSPDGGLVFYGGLAGALVAGLSYARRVGVSGWLLADIYAPATALGLVWGRVGCLGGGCCFGRPADWPLGVVVPSDEGFRFLAVRYAAFALDGQIFASVEDARLTIGAALNAGHES